MERIRLTASNEDLIAPEKQNTGWGDKTDKSKLRRSFTGVHDICGGWFDIKEVSITHNALLCRGCRLRILFPNNIKTYGQLRKNFLM